MKWPLANGDFIIGCCPLLVLVKWQVLEDLSSSLSTMSNLGHSHLMNVGSEPFFLQSVDLVVELRFSHTSEWVDRHMEIGCKGRLRYRFIEPKLI